MTWQSLPTVAERYAAFRSGMVIRHSPEWDENHRALNRKNKKNISAGVTPKKNPAPLKSGA